MSVRGGASLNVRQSSTGNHFFEEYTSTTLYVERAFGFTAQHVTITNDATTDIDIDVSWDGATLHGSLKKKESIEYHPAEQSSVYLRADSGTPTIRVFAE